jgi:hypothetical protein
MDGEMKRILFALALIGCGGGGGETAGGGPTAPTATTAAPATPGLNISWSADNHKVDKVGAEDGAVKPDGKPDVVIDADVQGPAKALYVATVTGKGEPTGDFQADTLVRDEEPPVELSLAGPHGKATSGLFVYEGGKLLNAADGSLRDLAAGAHKLTIHFADHASVKDGVRLWVQKPDGSLAISPILK